MYAYDTAKRCHVADFLKDREEKARGKARSNPALAAGYLLAAGELKLVRFDHASECAACLSAEASQAPVGLQGVASIAGAPRTAVQA